MGAEIGKAVLQQELLSHPGQTGDTPSRSKATPGSREEAEAGPRHSAPWGRSSPGKFLKLISSL